MLRGQEGTASYIVKKNVIIQILSQVEYATPDNGWFQGLPKKSNQYQIEDGSSKLTSCTTLQENNNMNVYDIMDSIWEQINIHV